MLDGTPDGERENGLIWELSQRHRVDTPENVAFRYATAGIGNRFLAAALDTIILILLLSVVEILTYFALEATGDLLSFEDALSWAGGAVIAVSALINFLLIWGYYILFETLWNGQTPGKRRMKIRVIEKSGAPAGLGSIIIRNLVRIIDFLPVFYGLGILIMFINARSQRLGDLAAGTIVIKEGAPVALDSLFDQTPEALPGPQLAYPDETGTHSMPSHRLSSADHDLIAAALDRHDRNEIPSSTLNRLARVIAAKIGVEPPGVLGSVTFLRDVNRGEPTTTRPGPANETSGPVQSDSEHSDGTQ